MYLSPWWLSLYTSLPLWPAVLYIWDLYFLYDVKALYIGRNFRRNFREISPTFSRFSWSNVFSKNPTIHNISLWYWKSREISMKTHRNFSRAGHTVQFSVCHHASWRNTTNFPHTLLTTPRRTTTETSAESDRRSSFFILGGPFQVCLHRCSLSILFYD